MRLLLLSQLASALIAGAILGILGDWSDFPAMVYGALLGMLNSLLTRRSSDRALSAAVKNPAHGLVAMFSGFALRYAVAILGLLAGFRMLHLAAEPMIGGFILMIVIQVLASTWVRPEENRRDA